MNDKNLRMVNNLILYIFKEKEDADRFMVIIGNYISKDFKHCRDGQVFWPEFRILTKRAINYNEIQKITPTRKCVLDNMGIEKDFQWFQSAQKKGKLLK
jgi:hypothetical protein